MAESTDIKLPRSHAAEFPDSCVVCRRAAPSSHVRLVTGTLGWWTWLLWFWGRPFVVKAPACRGCAWWLHFLRFMSLVVTIGIAVAVVLWVWPHFKNFVAPGLQQWALMGLILVCALPYFIFQIYFAQPFDVTAFSDSVDYEFASGDYAIEFAMLNLGAEWVKINGHKYDGPEGLSEAEKLALYSDIRDMRRLESEVARLEARLQEIQVPKSTE